MKKNSVTAVILAGGKGTRLAELTKVLPKPLIRIGTKPIIWHIMKIYSFYGINKFIICLGYKGHLLKKELIKYRNTENWDINFANTGLNTMTGGRIKRIKRYIGEDKIFSLSYGDGVSNVNINKLVKFHKKHGKLVTVTAVRPMSRFGRLDIEGNRVIQFKEKTQMDRGWINGGFFVFEKKFLDLIKNSKTILEKEPLEKACLKRSLVAYKHKKFWQCMDTKRDHELLEKLWIKGAPWIL